MSCFDPLQVFEVESQPCMLFHVHVIEGRNVTKGKFYNMLDTPDPYLCLCVKSAPNGNRKTATNDNEMNPKWNEKFTFLLDTRTENILDISLMDSNYTYDGKLGCSQFYINELKFGETKFKTFIFNQVTEIDVELRIEESTSQTLRYNVCLSDEENRFLEKRKVKVMQALQCLLGARGPADMSQVPTIGVLGSGGGFRALTGMSGVFTALAESGLLDCVTYVATLSGSSWYLSTLYSHNDWPQMKPRELLNELRSSIDSSFLWLLSLRNVTRFLRDIRQKRKRGQPVSFTDFFGRLVGETLIKNRIDVKLSDQQRSLEQADVPMPLYACVHAKKKVSAKYFQDWVEFSPYEIGMPKYGAFMKTSLFGSKFFLGHICKQFDEPPLHFLQGIWGSAFCILFGRLAQQKKQHDKTTEDQVDYGHNDLGDAIDNDADDEHESSDSEDESENDDVDEDDVDGDDVDDVDEDVVDGKFLDFNSKEAHADGSPHLPGFLKGFFGGLCKRLPFLGTRKGRAGAVHNPLRGLSLLNSYPISPFTPEAGEYVGLFEKSSTSLKKLFMVDAGLAMNSPYPLLLRSQRHVDIYLSFDFTARPADNADPFKELLSAEKWARENFVPFPPIDVAEFSPDNMQEMYVFRHPTDSHCPVVLHFVLANINFRKFKTPGVRRETDDEIEFGDFSLFDDARKPYSTFNFSYSHKDFDRLSQLMEFNVMTSLDAIKDAIADCIERKRNRPPKENANPCIIKERRIQILKKVKCQHKCPTQICKCRDFDKAKNSRENVCQVSGGDQQG